MIQKTKRRKFTEQFNAQDGRCVLTGERLTPQSVFAVLEEPTSNPTVDDVRFVTHEVSRLVAGIGFTKLTELCERILRHRKPELFRESGGDSSTESG